MAEGAFRGAQQQFALPAGGGVQRRQAGGIRHAPQVVEVSGNPFMLYHHCAQGGGARRDGDVERRLGGAGEGQRVRDRRLRRQPRHEPHRRPRRLTEHQRQRALVRVAQPGLGAQHRFAPRGDAQMCRFLDRAVNRADWELHHLRFVHGGKFRRLHGATRQAGPRRQRMGERPSPVVEPVAVVAPAFRDVAPEVADHALEPRRGWPGGGKGRVASGLDGDRCSQDIAAAAEQRVHLDRVGP